MIAIVIAALLSSAASAARVAPLSGLVPAARPSAPAVSAAALAAPQARPTAIAAPQARPMAIAAPAAALAAQAPASRAAALPPVRERALFEAVRAQKDSLSFDGDAVLRAIDADPSLASLDPVMKGGLLANLREAAPADFDRVVDTFRYRKGLALVEPFDGGDPIISRIVTPMERYAYSAVRVTAGTTRVLGDKEDSGRGHALRIIRDFLRDEPEHTLLDETSWRVGPPDVDGLARTIAMAWPASVRPEARAVKATVERSLAAVGTAAGLEEFRARAEVLWQGARVGALEAAVVRDRLTSRFLAVLIRSEKVRPYSSADIVRLEAEGRLPTLPPGESARPRKPGRHVAAAEAHFEKQLSALFPDYRRVHVDAARGQVYYGDPERPMLPWIRLSALAGWVTEAGWTRPIRRYSADELAALSEGGHLPVLDVRLRQERAGYHREATAGLGRTVYESELEPSFPGFRLAKVDGPRAIFRHREPGVPSLVIETGPASVVRVSWGVPNGAEERVVQALEAARRSKDEPAAVARALRRALDHNPYQSSELNGEDRDLLVARLMDPRLRRRTTRSLLAEALSPLLAREPRTKEARAVTAAELEKFRDSNLAALWADGVNSIGIGADSGGRPALLVGTKDAAAREAVVKAHAFVPGLDRFTVIYEANGAPQPLVVESAVRR